MTQEQAIQMLQKLNMQQHNNLGNGGSDGSGSDNATVGGGYSNAVSASVFGEHRTHPPLQSNVDDSSRSYESFPSNGFQSRPEIHRVQSAFAPFSPDPNAYATDMKHRDSFSRADMLPHPSKAYAPGFFPIQTQDLKVNTNGGGTAKTSPSSVRPPSATRYNTFLDNSNGSFPLNRAPGRPEGPISRPSSGQTSVGGGGGGRTDHEGQDFDAMHDLNGTLASLDLDRPWKNTPEGSSSSSGSVQFRLTRTPSP